MELSRVTSCTMCMQPSKSVSSASTRAPLAIGWMSCAVVILPLGRKTSAGMPAVAAYAASAAEVSPVDAHATARTGQPVCAIIWLTALTSTVIPRSLNDPVWLTPHCLTHSSGPMPRSRPSRGTGSSGV